MGALFCVIRMFCPERSCAKRDCLNEVVTVPTFGNLSAAKASPLHEGSLKLKTLVLFYSHWPHLNKGVFVMVVFPMPFVTVPVPIMMVMPVFVVPIVVRSILVSLNR